MITSTVLELIIYPVIYVIWKERELKKAGDRRQGAGVRRDEFVVGSSEFGVKN